MKTAPVRNHNVIKAYKGMELNLQTFWTWGTDVDQCYTSLVDRLNSIKERPASLYENMSGHQVQSGNAGRKHA
jgi:hypothetical protein